MSLSSLSTIASKWLPLGLRNGELLRQYLNSKRQDWRPSYYKDTHHYLSRCLRSLVGHG